MPSATDPQNTKDDYRTVIASILIAKAAVATFSIAPFLIGSYIDHLGLSAVQASRVLAAEILALAVANAAGFLWFQHADPRLLARRLLLSLIALNISCVFAADYISLLLLRAVIGSIEGSLLVVGFGLLGLTRRPERNFGLYFAISLTVGAINVRVLPLFLEGGAVAGLFTNLSLYGLVALAGTVWLPLRHDSSLRQSGEGPADATMQRALTITPFALLLAANYVYFVGQGGVWSFLERLGQQHHLPLDAIASALSISLLAGVAGGFAAGWLDLKLGRIAPLLLAICCAIASLAVLWNAPDAADFVTAACLFNFGNNFGHPYTLGLASRIDASGRLTVLSGALHTGGQATGPFIVGMLVAPPDYTIALWVGLCMFALTPLLIAPAALLYRHDARRAAAVR